MSADDFKTVQTQCLILFLLKHTCVQDGAKLFAGVNRQKLHTGQS